MKRGEKGKLNTRVWMLIAIFAVLLCVLLIFLDKLAIRETEAYSAAVRQTTEVTTYQSGSRGTITDRNGVVLAYDETTYNVLFYRDPSNRTPVDSARYTHSLIEAIRIIEEGGGQTIDTFYIDMRADGTFVYDFRTTNESVAAPSARQVPSGWSTESEPPHQVGANLRTISERGSPQRFSAITRSSRSFLAAISHVDGVFGAVTSIGASPAKRAKRLCSISCLRGE
jgi:penicillin-binding protein 2